MLLHHELWILGSHLKHTFISFMVILSPQTIINGGRTEGSLIIRRLPDLVHIINQVIE
jgi:hypothetical protein